MTTFDITIPAGPLRAALLTAPAKDIRFHLNGVHVELHKDGRAFVVATDGAMMTVGETTYTTQGADPVQPCAFTIPHAMLKSALHAKADTVRVSLAADGTITTDAGRGAFTGKPVDGAYPDWRFVVPEVRDGVVSNPSGAPYPEPNHARPAFAYDPALLLKAAQAAQAHFGTRLAPHLGMAYGDYGKAVLTAPTSGFVAVVMPLRENPAPVATPDFGEAPPALQ